MVARLTVEDYYASSIQQCIRPFNMRMDEIHCALYYCWPNKIGSGIWMNLYCPIKKKREVITQFSFVISILQYLLPAANSKGKATTRQISMQSSILEKSFSSEHANALSLWYSILNRSNPAFLMRRQFAISFQIVWFDDFRGDSTIYLTIFRICHLQSAPVSYAPD